MSTRHYCDIQIGDTLPELEIHVSTSLIIASAIASRDYQAVHHDKTEAVALGSKDIFMNILTTNGLVGRFITDWTGPEGELKNVHIKLGVPNYAGDTMILSGKVAEKINNGSETLVVVDVKGKNTLGDHVTGSVIVALP